MAASKGELQTPVVLQISRKPLVVNRLILKGVWWSIDSTSPTAAFKIEDSTVYYPDREGEATFRYELNGDTLVIHFDSYDSNSIIVKIEGDTLVLHDSDSRNIDTLLRRSI